MKIQDIYNKAVQMGIDADPRTNEYIAKLLEKRKQKFEKLSDSQKKEFDQESLTNPYSDTRILHIAEDREVRKALVGIDIEPAEILLAKQLDDIDLVISHHPLGRALADLHEVMELQVDLLNQYGVPVNITEGLLKERISEVARGLNPRNNWRTVDTAKLLGVNLICLHTATDNNAAQFLRDRIEGKDLERLEDLMEVLKEIEEYKIAIEMGAGPKLFVGSPESRCGKIALTEITGGTEGSPKLMEKMAQAGIGTIVGMHTSEDHKKEAEAANLNVVIAGHMSSDSIGMNIILDELEKQGIEIVPCSGFLRVSRVASS
ncbi:MAG: NGG1p interacting factor NIF3 [Candidatus Wildermuthbacteria bacterium RIFCSPHIGHO2_02_FULL_49_9]|uniref:NGG1p interacting factor NIF3 n=2 Tax=Candidatus Wildermuthiibacteriota TaxID=1817923 RepID=A0A1G2QXA5_9BACT|nr:MAG: NGG1p interacting factor NIF3 [Candidatus Wildermuthbacteria bacterium RIFCSPHIGHO2_01_FULL_49_22b]OHA70404.1 MAG: NGG1p interacting factor NIF3 [Candidatus Wildermuthbacteria bacterium RIFCSPHIGHO2_02_FULL_49_9]